MLHVQYYIRMLNAEKEKKYVRVIEAAEILDVHPATISRWIEKGTIKDAYKLNPELLNSPFLIAQHEIVRILKLRQGEG